MTIKGANNRVNRDGTRSSSSWEGGVTGLERALQRAAPPPARADRRGDQRGADGGPAELPRPRRSRRPRDQRGHDGAESTREDIGEADEALAEWINRWGREPSWMYLPHLREGGSDIAKDEADAASMAEGGSVTGGGGGGGATSVAVHAIKGRGHSPGPRDSNDATSGSAAGLGASAADQGHARRPGPGDVQKRSGAKARTSELEAWLQRAKAAQAELGAKRGGEAMRGSQPSAAERMAALRRRISARAAAAPRERTEGSANVPTCVSGEAAREGVRSGCTLPTGSPTSIEDEKMQLDLEGRIQNDGPAGVPTEGGSAAELLQSCGGDGARRAAPSADVGDAARRVAWHTVDEEVRLTRSQRAG